MGIKISLWNGDNWATRGGKDKVDWSKGPFIASFRNYKIDACFGMEIQGFAEQKAPQIGGISRDITLLHLRKKKISNLRLSCHREMGSSSRELLHLEQKNLSAASSIESTLLVCKRESVSHTKKAPPDGKPTTSPVAQSQVLGKVKDFLGVISEANKRLQKAAEDNSLNYDIEVLTGTESEVIEMDLMLGIADLHTPEAIAAAESAISSGQPLVPSDSDSSETESEGTSDNDDNKVESDNDDDKDNNNDEQTGSSLKRKTSSFVEEGSSQAAGRNGSKKRPKIVEMC
ncbi:hypothetical protein GH714_008808 [Hevea brasiliensis]|uniref:GH16 domain-containing protein n=1 Tax=Hevea brasiliensis TaxID=3981 RepID=A0A6A6KYZ5_HEVBR|nr:hypothetical protein GH714_008808 [Hevea brasiliensis]